MPLPLKSRCQECKNYHKAITETIQRCSNKEQVRKQQKPHFPSHLWPLLRSPQRLCLQGYVRSAVLEATGVVFPTWCCYLIPSHCPVIQDSRMQKEKVTSGAILVILTLFFKTSNSFVKRTHRPLSVKVRKEMLKD